MLLKYQFKICSKLKQYTVQFIVRGWTFCSLNDYGLENFIKIIEKIMID